MMNTKIPFLKLFQLLVLMILPSISFCQDSSVTQPKEYVRATFENGVVINNQTIESCGRKTLEFMIQHRFGLIKDVDDLYGIYAPANIRLGLNYGITQKLVIGAGATKNKSLYDLEGKYTFLKQTKGKGTPVSLAVYGNVVKSALPDDDFVNSEGEFKKQNKFSFFGEVMAARKFNGKVSIQVAGTYSHYNIIDSAYEKHDFYGASFVGRYKFSPQSSVMVDFDYLLNVSDIDEATKPKPNLGIGYEVSTGSHQFQIFVCNATGIINQENRVYNHNDFFKGDVVLGFNITRTWGFK
jgi:hypothetical protein